MLYRPRYGRWRTGTFFHCPYHRLQVFPDSTAIPTPRVNDVSSNYENKCDTSCNPPHLNTFLAS